jgi:predicted Na+-dependent transporter
MAPLSIVMTALSTATAALITPVLTQMLLGQRLPVDVKGMMVSILQCVIAPIGARLALNR